MVLGGVNVTLNHFTHQNLKAEKLCATFVSPSQAEGKRPCVIYMHGNASNKTEGLSLMNDLIPKGIDLLTFDFSGCGNSEGQWVTLGYKEKDDLHVML